MTLDSLTADEKLALVALLKLVVRADRELSSDEVKELNEVARQMGPDEWRATVDRARERFRTAQEVTQFAETITRQQAQRLIHKLLVRAARADGIVPEEASILLWLAKLWRIR